jgi:hypothetical protein
MINLILVSLFSNYLFGCSTRLNNTIKSSECKTPKCDINKVENALSVMVKYKQKWEKGIIVTTFGDGEYGIYLTNSKKTIIKFAKKCTNDDTCRLHSDSEWEKLDKCVTKNLIKLGWNKEKWAGRFGFFEDLKPDTEIRNWTGLTANQQCAAISLGFDETTWKSFSFYPYFGKFNQDPLQKCSGWSCSKFEEGKYCITKDKQYRCLYQEELKNKNCKNGKKNKDKGPYCWI